MNITPLMTEQQVMRETQNAAKTLNTAQQEEATGLAFQTPAQNPDGAVTTVNLEAQIQRVSLYKTDQTNAKGQLNATANALQTMVNTMNQAQQLAVQGGNSTNSSTDEHDIASQVKALRSTLVSALNSQYNGVSLFAANPQALTASVATTTSVVNLPSSSSVAPYTNVLSVGPAASVAINVNGFETGASVSVFQTALNAMNNLLTALPTGQTKSAIKSLKQAETGLTNEQGVVGGRLDQIQAQSAQASSWATTLKTTLGKADQANLPQVTTQFATAGQIMQASLQSTSKVLGLNLWNMIKP